MLTELRVVLHPYYKLAYIKLAWGGAEEQAAEKATGNLSAKNWQDEALKVLENEVLYLFRFHSLKFTDISDGKILGEPSTIYSEHWYSN